MEAQGKIQRIRKDRKAISLGPDNWYQFFKPITEDFNKEDNVKIIYSEKKLDDILFKNAKSMVKIKNDIEVKPKVLNNEPLLKQILTATDKNCILMTAKDIFISPRALGSDKVFDKIVEEIKLIRLNL